MEKVSIENQYYGNLNGLKTVAAFGIIAMHVSANMGHILPFPKVTYLIGSMTHFVKLFLILSGFGMCCGYYERFKSGNIDLQKFYSRRFVKNFPFFALLVLIEVIASKGTASLNEVYANLTMAFNLMPSHEVSVIGAGWTLGVIFVFYFMFPFYVFLLWTKSRAWFTLIICIGLNLCCCNFFAISGKEEGSNFLFLSVYFVAGGLIYLYRKELKALIGHWLKGIPILLNLIVLMLWLAIPAEEYSLLFTIKTLILFTAWVSCTISRSSVVLNNSVTKFVSNISLEVYLSHMMIFRVLQIFNLLHVSNNKTVSYVVVYMLTLVLTVLFATISKAFLEKVITAFSKKNS